MSPVERSPDARAAGALPVAPLPDTAALLVALRASGQLHAPREIRCTGLLERPSTGWSRMDRLRILDAVTVGTRAWVDDAMVAEPVGSQRWLAWFPRPTGPRHAVNMSSPVVAALAGRVPGVALVRAHLAVKSWQAEVLQAMGNAARFESGRRRLQAWVERGGPVDDSRARWAVVVEVLGDHDMLVRGWAHGTRRASTAAALASLLAPDRAPHTSPADDVGGTRAEVAQPGRGDALDGLGGTWQLTGARAAELLDRVAMEPDRDLRWSVGAPSPIER